MNDLFVLYAALMAAYSICVNILPHFLRVESKAGLTLMQNLWWIPLLCMVVMAYEGLYYKRCSYWHEVKLIVKAVTLAMFLTMIFLFIFNGGGNAAKLIILLTYFFVMIFQPLGRYFIKNCLNKAGFWVKPVLALGNEKTIMILARGFAREKTMGYRLVGSLLEHAGSKESPAYNGSFIPVLGTFTDVEVVLEKSGVRDVVVAVPGMSSEALVKLINRLRQIPASVLLVPDLFGVPMPDTEISCLFDEKTLFLSMKNNLASRWNRVLKRTFDLLVGSIVLVLAAPAMLLIAAAIKLDSPGKVFFNHDRIGKGGKMFKCIKFRTMVENSGEVLEKLLVENPQARQEWEKDFKLRNDPRITMTGRILRKTSLDELPQILNVIAGQMSLVGPRPIIAKEIEKYGQYFEDYITVPPGVTGLWQVSGRNDVDYGERVLLDSWYVKNWSLWLDVTILIRTVGVVLGRRGAY
ncbi:MAG: undecaprenyl-phosphate galactose phosphotransferase WbaP [Peptococcaceae bacterium]|nr:undecaprenyl-phosphate galactose phosphotransferase WbaP [Peptococcaceae bacterium]MDH7524528.1 undecaprenyl-phosphate galactose phosphotransferase WbaP [Peptococcaceae bacterium]